MFRLIYNHLSHVNCYNLTRSVGTEITKSPQSNQTCHIFILEVSLEWIYFQWWFPKELNPQFPWNWSPIRVSKAAPTLVAFPLMGVGTDFTVPAAPSTGNVASRSTLVPDECINPHPRNLTQMNGICGWRCFTSIIVISVGTDSRGWVFLRR